MKCMNKYTTPCRHEFTKRTGASLVVQWLRLQALSAGSIPGQGSRSHVLQLKIPHATRKMPHMTTKTHNKNSDPK